MWQLLEHPDAWCLLSAVTLMAHRSCHTVSEGLPQAQQSADGGHGGGIATARTCRCRFSLQPTDLNSSSWSHVTSGGSGIVCVLLICAQLSLRSCCSSEAVGESRSGHKWLFLPQLALFPNKVKAGTYSLKEETLCGTGLSTCTVVPGSLFHEW